ncbi:MAG: hypothetical protein JW837_03965 [Sedimentisphaerales bacterium]|nr:hypothetical protein [Sedimentisphaerales bacterium]
MKNKEQKLFSEKVNQQVIIIALLLVLVGVILIWSTIGTQWVVTQQLGSLLFVTGTITLSWELAVKRAFLDEILVKTQVSRDVAFAGLLKITNRFHDDIDWRDYIEKSNKIDIFFAYGRTWRGTHEEHLKTALKNNKARIRIVLPDPNDSATVKELTRRFDIEQPEELKKRIEESVKYFKELNDFAENENGSVEVWFLPECPVFSFYRFNQFGILATYKHQRGRGNVPTFVCEQGGTLYDFMCQEFDAMIKDNGLAQKINLA